MAVTRLVASTLVLGLALVGPAAVLGQGTEEKTAAYKARVLAVSKKIDELIYAKQKMAGVKAGDRAEDGVFFRRLHIDLVGKIPYFTDVDDYLGNDEADKLWMWVERMLENKGNSAHLAAVFRSHILGSTQQNPAFTQPQFEAFLRDRFEKNYGYDRMVHEILTSSADGRFPGGGMGAAGGNPSAFFFANENKPENLAAATTRVFLGVKLECAQCHAHPFAKWTRDQFWEFAAFYSARARFAPVVPKMAVAPIKPGEIEIPGLKKVVKAKYLGDDEEAKLGDGVDPQKALADWVVSSSNPYFAKANADFVWSYFFGVSLLEPIIEPSDDAPITHPELLDLLAQEFIASKFDIRHLIRAIVHTEAYQRASTGKDKLSPDEYNLFIRMPVRGMTPEQLFDSVAQATEYDASRFTPAMGMPMFPGMTGNPRADFLTKFASQDRRHETQTSILQALFLMNSKFMQERLDPAQNKNLSHLLSQPTDISRKVRSLYWIVLSRNPRPAELERMTRYIETGGPTTDSRKALVDVYWALLNSAEFMLNH